MTVSILLLFLFVGKTLCQYKAMCPAKELIRPCSCTIDVNKLPWLSCEGVTSLDRFEKILDALRGSALSTLNVEKSNLGRIPANLFLGMEIKSMKIMSNNLTKMGDGHNRPPFLGLENSLEDIEIKESFVNEDSPMKSFSLAHLRKLTLFQSTNNLVPNIANDWFESGPYGLEQVIFESSFTQKIGSHAFSSLMYVRQISVTGGYISQLTRSMFPKPAFHLTVIDFSNNELVSLPGDIFRDMPSLEEVYLDSNGFTEINELVWSSVWNHITHVYFNGNPIDCNEDIKWIYKYRLPEVLIGSCIKPDKLQGKELNKLSLKDFA